MAEREMFVLLCDYNLWIFDCLLCQSRLSISSVARGSRCDNSGLQFLRSLFLGRPSFIVWEFHEFSLMNPQPVSKWRTRQTSEHKTMADSVNSEANFSVQQTSNTFTIFIAPFIPFPLKMSQCNKQGAERDEENKKAGSKGTSMTINQIKMLTTSCKNYKSLKQCVIEKGEVERRSGRKGELQTLKKVNGKLNYFVPAVNYLPGSFAKFWNEAIKSFVRNKAAKFLSSHVGNKVESSASMVQATWALRSYTFRHLEKGTTSFVTFLFRPFLLFQIPLGAEIFKKKASHVWNDNCAREVKKWKKRGGNGSVLTKATKHLSLQTFRGTFSSPPDRKSFSV